MFVSKGGNIKNSPKLVLVPTWVVNNYNVNNYKTEITALILLFVISLLLNVCLLSASCSIRFGCCVRFFVSY